MLEVSFEHTVQFIQSNVGKFFINCPNDNVKDSMELDNYVIGIKMPFVSMSKTNTVVNILSDTKLRGHIKPNSDILILETDEQYFGANDEDETVPLKISFNAIVNRKRKRSIGENLCFFLS